MLCSCFQSLGPKLESIAGEQSQNEHQSDAMRGPTPVWNYKGFLPLQGHQMLIFTVIKQHMRGDVQEASGTVATTLLSQDRAVQSFIVWQACILVSCLHSTFPWSRSGGSSKLKSQRCPAVAS